MEASEERGKEMHFSRLLLIVAAALPLGACFTSAEQIAANDDAACRSAGLKSGTPAYVQCLDDNRRLRLSQEAGMTVLRCENLSDVRLQGMEHNSKIGRRIQSNCPNDT